MIICIKMDLALNNLQKLICYKTQTTNQLIITDSTVTFMFHSFYTYSFCFVVVVVVVVFVVVVVVVVVLLLLLLLLLLIIIIIIIIIQFKILFYLLYFNQYKTHFLQIYIRNDCPLLHLQAPYLSIKNYT